MREVRFHKYQALGNDFVLLDAHTPGFSSWIQSLQDQGQWSKWVQHVCHRRLGVGADGVLLVSQGQKGTEIRLYNADGSYSPTCLNGLTTVAHHYARAHPDQPLHFQMGGRPYVCKVQSDAHNDGVGQVRASFPHAPVVEKALSVTVGGRSFSGWCVSLGNPHFIVFEQLDLQQVEHFGSLLESHPAFPDRTNVEFVWPDPQRAHHYHMRVYERGCGVTQACSSGAISVLGLLHHQGHLPPNTWGTIHMEGGSLQGVIEPSSITIHSQAAYVFLGECLGWGGYATSHPLSSWGQGVTS